jgi:bifunctional enzyme CysN/CysC
VEERLHDMGRHTYVLDGDSIRSGLNRDLGYEDADRIANIRRTAEVAKLMADAGLIVVVALISPFRAERSLARALLSDGEFLEVFVDTPVHVAEQRDVKGLYKKARSGELRNFTGIDSIYQSPESPELRLETVGISPEEAADRVVDLLRKRRFVLF